MLLIEFEDTYADEFWVKGFAIIPKARWDAHKKAVKEIWKNRPLEWQFGSNQFITWKNADEHFSKFTTKEIKNSDSVKALDDIFSLIYHHRQYGFFPNMIDSVPYSFCDDRVNKILEDFDNKHGYLIDSVLF